MSTIRRFNPRANFRCNTIELANLMFTHDELATAKELGVTLEQWQAWKAGETPTPKILWLYLKLKRQQESFKLWQGFTVDGDRLVSPFGDAIKQDEWHKLSDYRRAYKLSIKQAELIEKLMVERNFYRDQCHHQAKFGLMLNRLFK